MHNECPWEFDLEPGDLESTYLVIDTARVFSIHTQSLDNEDAINAAILDAFYSMHMLDEYGLRDYWIKWESPNDGMLMRFNAPDEPSAEVASFRLIPNENTF